jgi:hypothetical protein
MSNKRIYYYQTLCSLQNVLNNPDKIYPTHIILSAFHFGRDKNNSPYIHLNDFVPNDKMFDTVWLELEKANSLGIKIMIMLGGAGGAFTEMFTNYDYYYKLLKEFILSKKFICGIDLDVEEYINIDDIRKLIKQLDTDFDKDFIITMAPIANALITNYPGLGGFHYKRLIKTPEGERINWFNGQFYNEYSLNIFNQAVLNGFEPNRIVMGMVYYQFNKDTFSNALDTLLNIKNKYNNFGGAFVWEYFKAPSLNNYPEDWAVDIYNRLNKSNL